MHTGSGKINVSLHLNVLSPEWTVICSVLVRIINPCNSNMNAMISEWLTNHHLIKYTCTGDQMMITKDSINDLDVETNSPIANNHHRKMTTVRRMYLLIMRKTVAIQTRSVIGERNNRSLVGNNGSPAENNGSYSTRGPMKIEVWKRYCTIWSRWADRFFGSDNEYTCTTCCSTRAQFVRSKVKSKYTREKEVVTRLQHVWTGRPWKPD